MAPHIGAADSGLVKIGHALGGNVAVGTFINKQDGAIKVKINVSVTPWDKSGATLGI
jgi:hypothetical protein